MSQIITINNRRFIVQKPVLGLLADIEDEFDVSLREGNAAKALQEKTKKINQTIKLAAIIIKDENKPLSEKDLSEVTGFLREHAEPKDLEKIVSFFLSGTPKNQKKPSGTSKDTASKMELVNEENKK